MAKIYEDAKDLHVVATLIYKKTAETKAYKDSDLTIQYATSELKEVFTKGALIVLEDGSIVKPFKYVLDSTIGTVYYIEPNGVTATSADIASLVATADPA